MSSEKQSRNICRAQSCCCDGCGHKDTGCQGSAARPPVLEARTGINLRCELELAQSQSLGGQSQGGMFPLGGAAPGFAAWWDVLDTRAVLGNGAAGPGTGTSPGQTSS